MTTQAGIEWYRAGFETEDTTEPLIFCLVTIQHYTTVLCATPIVTETCGKNNGKTSTSPSFGWRLSLVTNVARIMFARVGTFANEDATGPMMFCVQRWLAVLKNSDDKIQTLNKFENIENIWNHKGWPPQPRPQSPSENTNHEGWPPQPRPQSPSKKTKGGLELLIL